MELQALACECAEEGMTEIALWASWGGGGVGAGGPRTTYPFSVMCVAGFWGRIGVLNLAGETPECR